MSLGFPHEIGVLPLPSVTMSINGPGPADITIDELLLFQGIDEDQLNDNDDIVPNIRLSFPQDTHLSRAPVRYNTSLRFKHDIAKVNLAQLQFTSKSVITAFTDCRSLTELMVAGTLSG